ncbi:hypothetical protein FRC96_04685 [Lujinxingia vulgaris]|uniref:RCC1-like domain-containing protein n=1 Tax=Lujinxingia vulgaris TaxID=2600176 RepID=A0A5C6XDQ7_9DELT|nr:hypothetical protein [Lujinxingia vulgaris]TXD41283.1 hypothetical protein FRC96_04685 [Lujinxingia vulgaris]
MNRHVFVLCATLLMLLSACGNGDAERRRGDSPQPGTCEPACETGFSCVNSECYVQVRPEDCGEDEEFDPRLRVCLTPQCDDGVQNGEEEGVDCGGDCEACEIPELCGNGEIDEGEACDHGGTIQLACAYGESSCEVCNVRCELVPGQVTGFCGDDQVQAGGGEECDHGGSPQTACPDGEDVCQVCAEDCTLVAGEASGSCGDGVIQGEEECDGAALGGASCQSLDLPEGELSCAANCTYDTAACVASDGIEELALGYSHTCARRADGSVYCWGRNDDGRLGDGGSSDRVTPTAVVGLDDAVQISAGGYHTCAIRENGTVVCWGDNADGQLGNGTGVGSRLPTPVPGLTNVTAITTGTWHTCAVTGRGAAYCWGQNNYGQLGDGRAVGSSSPVLVSIGLSDATRIDAANFHTCARRNNGALVCWGRNTYGELGDPNFTLSYSEEALVQVRGPNGTATLSGDFIGLGNGFTCARTDQGQVYCWGINGEGQLGTGVAGTSYYAGLVGTGFAQLSVGEFHACARDSAGAVSCWGRGSEGRLGLGNIANYDQPQTLVMPAVEHVEAGGTHTCAILQDGRVMCWGRNSNGQLGDGTLNDRLVPTEVGF